MLTLAMKIEKTVERAMKNNFEVRKSLTRL
jgi:hypothetical protein